MNMMKKAIKERSFFLLPLITGLVLFIGCGSSPEAASGDMANDLPAFVLNPPTDEAMLFGIGGAKQANAQRSIQVADMRARQDIAGQLTILAKGMITDYSREAGIEGSKTALEFQEIVGRQLINVELTGVRVIKREPAKDGTLYSLLAMNKEDMLKQSAVILDSEASRYAEFKAMNSLEEMERQLEKAGTKPTVIVN
jgi:hypothetical protein